MTFSLRPLFLLLKKINLAVKRELMTVWFLIFDEIYFSTNARLITKEQPIWNFRKYRG